MDYRDSYYGSVLDPLHGDIKLSEIEKWCLSQPIFSRLRRIKQNTFLYYVFPSANHTRFEHSIGVMHLAGKIFDACKENYATGQKKREKYLLSQESSFFDLNTLGEREEVFYQELRLAALLHDLGHGPLSHLFDEFAISKESFMKVIKSDVHLIQYKEGFEELIESNKGKIEHEIISCTFIFYLIDELKTIAFYNPKKFSPSAKLLIENIDAERIVKLIEPKFIGCKDFLDDVGINYTTFFSRIITAFPIDADRMDYLLRDSYFSGVTYGIYDINRIFASFLATIKNNSVELTYKESGLDSMLRFIQSRSHLYNQVYFHKTNRAANLMLTCGTKIAREKEAKLSENINCVSKLIEFYLKNSDEYFLKATAVESISGSELEKDILNELIDRKLFKRIYQWKTVLNQNEKDEISKIKEIKDAIQSKVESITGTDSTSFYAVDLSINEVFKDFDLKPILIAKKKGESYQFGDNWKSINTEFAQTDLTICMLRIYVRRTFQSPDQFEKLKDIMNNAIKEEKEELNKIVAE